MAPKRKVADKSSNPKRQKKSKNIEKESNDILNSTEARLNDQALEESIRAGDTQIEGTAKSYKLYTDKFSIYIDKKGKLESEDFSDINVAGFLKSLGEKHEFKPHIKKSCMASLHDIFIKMIPPLDNIYNFPSNWPLSTLAVKVRIQYLCFIYLIILFV
jgi:hypothetical protein